MGKLWGGNALSLLKKLKLVKVGNGKKFLIISQENFLGDISIFVEKGKIMGKFQEF